MPCLFLHVSELIDDFSPGLVDQELDILQAEALSVLELRLGLLAESLGVHPFAIFCSFFCSCPLYEPIKAGLDEDVAVGSGRDVVRVVEAKWPQRGRLSKFKVGVRTHDALHEERELGVHVAVESLEQRIADVFAHFGVTDNTKAGFAPENK